MSAALGTIGFRPRLLVVTGGASAQVTTADVGINPTFEQPAQPQSFPRRIFFGAAFFSNSTDYTTGTLTYGAGLAPTLSYVAPAT